PLRLAGGSMGALSLHSLCAARADAGALGLVRRQGRRLEAAAGRAWLGLELRLHDRSRSGGEPERPGSRSGARGVSRYGDPADGLVRRVRLDASEQLQQTWRADPQPPRRPLWRIGGALTPPPRDLHP